MRPLGPLYGWVRHSIAACAEGLFPTNDQGIPDWMSTQVTERTLSYLQVLPPFERHLLGLLYVGIDLVPLLLGHFARLSSLPATRRAELVNAWRVGEITPLRQLGDALKAQLTMMYLSHPQAIAYVGETAICTNDEDVFQPALPAPRPATQAHR